MTSAPGRRLFSGAATAPFLGSIALTVCLWLAGSGVSSGLPFPAAALKDAKIWKEPAFLGEFHPEKPQTRLAHKFWPEATPIFGLRPHSITGRFDGEELKSLTILFLDSGTHFGYVPDDKARETELANRDQFRALYRKVESAVRAGLGQLSGNRRQPVNLGTQPMLQQGVSLYQTGTLFARLHAIDEQLVKLTIFPNAKLARNWIDPAELELRDRERGLKFAKNAVRQPNGDVLLTNIPLLPQGDRAYCGVSALAMAMQYLGLNIDTEDYAAAAGIRYGSTRGSYIREVYDAASEEAGFRMSRATKFDWEKAKQSIDAGVPVLVWRRWLQERDFFHSVFAKRYRKDPSVELPLADYDDSRMWPTKDAYTHATVINGYNDERGEVIFSESWSEHVRDRRMRWEEMEGTAYYTFYFRL